MNWNSVSSKWEKEEININLTINTVTTDKNKKLSNHNTIKPQGNRSNFIPTFTILIVLSVLVKHLNKISPQNFDQLKAIDHLIKIE